MTDMPETIWADPYRWTDLKAGEWCTRGGSHQYTRTDIAQAKIDARRAENDRMRRALNMVDALDPEELAGLCSQDALCGLVRKMGDFARAALQEGKE